MFRAFTRPRYQVSVYRTIGPLVFSLVWAVEWQSFRGELLARVAVCSLCILTICNFIYFPFWFFRAALVSDCFSSWSLHTFYIPCFFQ